MSERARLFVAVDLDDEARRACAAVADRLRAHGFNAKWVPPENYHLTLAFIGSADVERVPEIVTALRDVAPQIKRFRVPLDTAGAFPKPSRARVVWVGPAKPVPGFASACLTVRGALEALGFSFDPHDDPHVTLARADGHAELPRVAAPRGIAVNGDSLVLYRSITAPSGARYEPLDRVEFG